MCPNPKPPFSVLALIMFSEGNVCSVQPAGCIYVLEKVSLSVDAACNTQTTMGLSSKGIVNPCFSQAKTYEGSYADPLPGECRQSPAVSKRAAGPPGKRWLARHSGWKPPPHPGPHLDYHPAFPGKPETL